MDKTRGFIERYVSALGIVGLFVVLYMASRYNYLLFHTAAELFSICVAFTIFVFAYYSRQFLDNDYFTFLGIAYLFVAGLDLLHTLSYKGMGVFEHADGNLATQLWIASRYLESGSLAAAFFFLKKKSSAPLILAGYILLCSALLAAIFLWEIFPLCFSSSGGLTTFKIISEYLISAVLSLTLVLLFIYKAHFEKNVFLLLFASVLLTIISELFFTFYISVYDLSNLVGHMLKVLSFICIFIAIVQKGLKRPYDLMFREVIHKDHKLQEALKRSKRDYRLLADNISDVIWTCDLEFNWSYISPSIEKITGYTQNEAMSLSLEQMMPPDSAEKANRELQIALETFHQDGFAETTSTLELELHHKDGSLVSVEVKSDIRKDDRGDPAGIIGIARDIRNRKKAEADKKKLEARLYRQQKMEATGRLASGIAHDFNNLLNVILANTELLAEDLEKDSDAHEQIDTIQEAISKARKVIRQLLRFSRQEPEKATRMDIEQVVKETVRLLKSSSSIKIRVTLHSENGPFVIMGDPTRIHQVVLNLVSNAIDAIGDTSGHVDVFLSHISFSEQNETPSENLAPGRYVKMTVSDSGHGIKPQDLEQIFDPYFTTKDRDKGTGLGLSVVQGIVKESGGDIIVHSRLGQGTTFDLYFHDLAEQSIHAA